MAEVGRVAFSERELLQASALFGDKAETILQIAARLNAAQPATQGPAPRDAGKFVRQLAALYCDDSERGRKARELIKALLYDAMQLVNLISEANPEQKP